MYASCGRAACVSWVLEFFGGDMRVTMTLIGKPVQRVMQDSLVLSEKESAAEAKAQGPHRTYVMS